MPRQQQVRFPSDNTPYLMMDLAAGFTWLAAIAGACAVHRVCWSEARLGSQLLLSEYGMRPGFEEAGLAFVFCGFALLLWLSCQGKAQPPGRHERIVLAAWWPALVAGLSLVFWVGPLGVRANNHALAVLTTETQVVVAALTNSGTAPSETELANLTRRVTRALPGLYGATEFRYERPLRRLRYADGLHFELDADGRVQRVRRDGRLDDEASARHRGRTETDVLAQMGPPRHCDVYFRGPWRLLLGAGEKWWGAGLVYSPLSNGWKPGHRPWRQSEDTDAPWSMWFPE